MSRPPSRPPRKFNPQPFAYHQEVDLEITTLTNMGQGLGRVDGWVIMVPYALPGELVRVRIYRNEKNFSEGDLVSVLRPSPHRTEPRCALFGTCGGCQYQHLAYAEQLAWKRRQVEELLQHMAKVEFPVAPVIASPHDYAYRSKITPHFEPDREGAVQEIGFLRQGRRREIVDVPHCHIATEAINTALPAERDAIRRRAWKRGATLLLRDTGSSVLTDPAATALTTVNGLTFEFLAGDFFQNNPFILPAFTRYAAEQAAQDGARHLIDAYCGSGLFSLCAASQFETVTGIEISVSAVERAAKNAARNGLTNCRFTAGSAEAIFENITLPPAETAVIIDPPRRGSDELFLTQLTAFAPRTIVYVSCNPATQMRDLRHLLDAGWELSAVQPFDLFPQTKHLECVITLRRPLSA
jgi:tRNA/tmRNA/rRNA uracil-C5-methylase (TrmA/RlmC/RlmD family)